MAFKNDSNPELISKSAVVVQALTPELYAYLVSLIPTPENVRTNHDRFTASYTASLGGDSEWVKECETNRDAVNRGLSILLGFAKAVTVTDPKVPEALGLGPLPGKTTAPIAALSQPRGFKVVYDPEGELISSVTSVKNAKGYQVWACEDDPNLESNWRLVASSPSCRGIVITGLNRSKPNWLKIRAMRGNGIPGPWSYCVHLTPR